MAVAEAVTTDARQIDAKIGSLHDQLIWCQQEVVDQQRRLSTLLDEVVGGLPEKSFSPDQLATFVNEREHLLDGFYLAFEDRFRYQRLTPLLSDSARLLHGWSDDKVAQGIHRLRKATSSAESAARGEQVSIDVEPAPTFDAVASLGLSDSRRRVENLYTALRHFTGVLSSVGVEELP